jgi:hypothetical protein
MELVHISSQKNMSVAAYPVHKPEAIYRINSSLENTKKESI